MKRLTVGMRARLKAESSWCEGHWEFDENTELLLVKRSHGSFSCMVLGQKELKKEDPNTVVNEIAWVDEEDLVFVNDDFEDNLDFIDWYQEHEDDFCPDCNAWFPDYGRTDPAIDDDYYCPNEKCPGNRIRDGKCPHCEPTVLLDKNDVCKACGYNDPHYNIL